MTVDKYNYMDKGGLRNRIRELEAELAGVRFRHAEQMARAEKAEALLRTAEEVAAEEQREYIQDYNALILERDVLKARVAELEAMVAIPRHPPLRHSPR